MRRLARRFVMTLQPRQMFANGWPSLSLLSSRLMKPHEQSGQVQRRHLWQVGEALPWRSTCQPSCERRSDYELKQTPQPWPEAADAASLRTLLADKVPGIRALAAEALATLHQPEDVSRLAALLSDRAEATVELQPPFHGQQDFTPVGPGEDAVTGHTWLNSSVASHAIWGLRLMLGECCPQAIYELHSTYSGTIYPLQPSQQTEIDSTMVSPLVTGDPKAHLWYWQEYIHRALHELDDATEDRVHTSNPGFDKLNGSRQSKLIYEERQRAKHEWMKSFFAQMQAWPAERRAMVRLFAYDVHLGGADMAYYDTPGWLYFNEPLELGLKKERILELLDGINLWPDERRDRGGESQAVERLAMAWEECFNADDVPRLRLRFSKGDHWWSARAALVVALCHLMPSTGTASDDPATAEGFLRHTLKEDHDVFIRILRCIRTHAHELGCSLALADGSILRRQGKWRLSSKPHPRMVRKGACRR